MLRTYVKLAGSFVFVAALSPCATACSGTAGAGEPGDADASTSDDGGAIDATGDATDPGSQDAAAPLDGGDGATDASTDTDAPTPGCGDGVVQAGEECDDGNKVDIDACTNACTKPTCAYVDGSQYAPIVGMAADIGGGQTLAQAMANNLVPGLSVAVRDSSGVVHAAVFGSANNQTYDPSAPALNTSTLFQAASISKAVSALAYLLHSTSPTTRNVDIGPAVQTFIVPPYPITPADLLSHSAGTAPHGFATGYAETDPLPTTQQIVLGQSPATSPGVTFDPQSVGIFSYSGGGYLLWQAWLESTTSTTLPNFVRDNLLLPAGATRSTFAQPLTAAAEHDAACGSSPLLKKTGECRRTYAELAAAGLWTTPSELACVAGYVTQKTPAVLSVVTSRALTVDFNNGNYPQKMGLGLFHRPANGVDESDGHMYEHSGLNEGFLSQMVFFDDGRAIVAMDNGLAAGGGISGFSVRALCRELGWSCTGKNVGP